MTGAVADKAVAFVDQKRVHLRFAAGDPVVARVYGLTGIYDVIAIPTGLACSCPAGSRDDSLDGCSHKLAAAVAWHEAALAVAA